MAHHSKRIGIIIRVVLLAGFGVTCVGCSSNLQKKAFHSCAPQRIGIVLGHDLGSVNRSATDEFMLGFLFGIPGAIANEASLDKSQVETGGAINARLIETVVSQLEEKGYSTCVLTRKQIKFKTFENIGGKPKHFDRLCAKYEVENKLADIDAVIFLEGRFEFRFFTPADGAKVNLEDVKTRSGLVKAQMFDCDSKKVLFTRAKGIEDTRNFNRVADKLLNLKKIPPKTETK